jgi:predicted methyltransferase
VVHSPLLALVLASTISALMNKFSRGPYVCTIALLLCACASHQTPTTTSAPTGASANAPISGANAGNGDNSNVNAKLTAVLAGPQRTPDERARDVYRHPRETLEFFGIQPGMHVVELSAGRGWYTAVLAPLLGEKGALTVTAADPNGPADSEGTKNAKVLAERIGADQGTFGNVLLRVVDWNLPNASLGPDASADMVLTFRNWHGWIRDGVLTTVLEATRRVLKSGGVFGVVEHRGKPDGSVDPKVIGETGYVPESLVIRVAEAAGFKLVAKSEINANPNDAKDYPKGVWTLPPTLRQGDLDREKYLRIGESDRMTLRFVKL